MMYHFLRYGFFFLTALVFLLACHNAPTNEPGNNSADTTDPVIRIGEDTVDAEHQIFVWEVDFENKTMKRNPQINDVQININTVISALNKIYPDITLTKNKVSHDTVFLEIGDAHVLTQQMGSSGAAQYLANAVLNLTEVKGIRFVKIDFEEGDHAAPGVWSKADYTDMKVIE